MNSFPLVTTQIGLYCKPGRALLAGLLLPECLLLCLWLLCSPSQGWAQNRLNDSTAYADVLLEYHYSGTNPKFTKLYGGKVTGPPNPQHIDPEVVLGYVPLYISLPDHSYVVVGFTDNQVIDYPNQPDIFLGEVGAMEERAAVYVSHNGEDFVYLGEAKDDRTSALDLADIGFDKPVVAVKVEGLDYKGASPGFDLIYVMGLPGANQPVYVSLEDLVEKLDAGKPLGNCKVILNNLHFEFNKANLTEASANSLNILALFMGRYPGLHIQISGHTDEVGGHEYNVTLSQQRAEAVKVYLEGKGIAASRMVSKGYGESRPMKSNATEQGRRVNRRVEFEIIDQ